MPILPDHLRPGLRAIFVGTAAGDVSAARRHYYAGPGNEFWQYLADSGLTDEYLGPDRDAEILSYGLGLTDIAKRRSAGTDALLVPSDFDVPSFVGKVARYQPNWVAFHGKTAAKEVARSLRVRGDIRLGKQAWTVADSLVYVLPSASGSNRSLDRLEGKPSRLAWFKDFRRTIERSR